MDINQNSGALFYDFINLTQVYNFTVNAQEILPSVNFQFLPFYRNLASTNADNETFCTVLLTSQVDMIQTLQPKGCEFKSMCVLFFFPFFTFIPFV